MTKQEAKKILATIRFLNHKFDLQDHFGHTRLVISVRAPDTRDRTQIVKIMHQSDIHLEMIDDAYHFTSHVFEALAATLRHEAAELFFVGDLLPFDEHDSPEQKHSKQEIVKSMFTSEQKQNTAPFGQDRSGVFRHEPHR